MTWWQRSAEEPIREPRRRSATCALFPLARCSHRELRHASAEAAEPLADPPEGLLDRIPRGRVGQPEVPLAVCAERGAPEIGDTGLGPTGHRDFLVGSA